MNDDVLRTMLETTRATAKRLGKKHFRMFVTPHQLAVDVDSGLICEPWSVEIVRRLLPERELVEPRLV